MGLENSTLLSVFRCTCPRCHRGKLFSNPNMYNIKTLPDMPDKCPICEQDFTIEVGFWWGAMYVGYALSVGFLLAMVGLHLLIFRDIPTGRLAFICLLSILFFPLTFRLARSIWIHIFVKYDPTYIKK